METAGSIYEAKSRLQREQPELVGTALALRTPTHTYVHRRYESDEFYDRLVDPNETTNLIGRTDDLELQRELLDAAARLVDRHLRRDPVGVEPASPEDRARPSPSLTLLTALMAERRRGVGSRTWQDFLAGLIWRCR